MAKRFEVGRKYRAEFYDLPDIKVIKRTAKMILVDNGETQFRMRLKEEMDGNEYVTDSTVPAHWQQAFTYYADRLSFEEG